MLKWIALVLFVIVFPSLALGIILGLLLHPLFFLLLILLVLALPALMALIRRPSRQGA